MHINAVSHCCVHWLRFMQSEWVFCIILIKFPLHWGEHENTFPVHSVDCWTFVSDPSIFPGGTTSYWAPTYPLSGDNVGPPYSTPSHGGKLGHSLVNLMGGHIQPSSEGKWANYTGSEIHIMIPPWRLCILTNTFALFWGERGRPHSPSLGGNVGHFLRR